MFGSNFFGNFGLPDFPYQGADPQGGYLGGNVPNDPLGQNAQPPAATPPAIAAPSPLAGGPLAPGAGQTPQQPNANPESPQAPAAGIGSPFQKIGGA